MPANENEILNLQINKLQFSEEFKTLAASLGFETLDEMLKVKVSVLLEKPGFTYHILQELVEFLENRGMASLLNE